MAAITEDIRLKTPAHYHNGHLYRIGGKVRLSSKVRKTLPGIDPNLSFTIKAIWLSYGRVLMTLQSEDYLFPIRIDEVVPATINNNQQARDLLESE